MNRLEQLLYELFIIRAILLSLAAILFLFAIILFLIFGTKPEPIFSISAVCVCLTAINAVVTILLVAIEKQNK